MQIVGQELKKLIYKDRTDWEKSNEGVYISTPQNDFNRDIQITDDSIDLRICDHGFIMNSKYKFINTLSEHSFDDHFEDTPLPLDGFVLEPGEILYIGTLERISLKGPYIGRISGRSTFARLGLSISSSQDKFCGYNDAIVCLQLRNNSKQGLKIYPYQKLAQILIYKTLGNSNMTNSAYANESEYTLPQITEKDRVQYDANTANRIAKLPSAKYNALRRGWDKFKNSKNGVKLANIIIGILSTFGVAFVSVFDIKTAYKVIFYILIMLIYLTISLIVNLFIDVD